MMLRREVWIVVGLFSGHRLPFCTFGLAVTGRISSSRQIEKRAVEGQEENQAREVHNVGVISFNCG
jgi:hypothetical protein